MKKLFVSLLCVVMMVTFMPSMAFADAGEAPANELPEAVNGKITLTKNVELNQTVDITEDTEIDLAGYTITGKDVRAFWVKSGKLTLSGSGKVTSVKDTTLQDSSSVIRVGDSEERKAAASLEVGAGVTVEGPATYGITAFGPNQETVVVKGTVIGLNPALSGLGTDKTNGADFTVEPGARLESTADIAVYHPQNGKMTVTGGEITGAKGGIEMKAGSLAISGTPVITAGGEKDHEANSDGTSTTGYAVAVVKNNSYAGNVNVTISEGTLKGAVGIVDDNAPETEVTDTDAIKVSGGAYTDLAGVVKYVQAESTIKLAETVNEGAGVVVPSGKNFTLDFQGNTYTVTNRFAGSAGTESQCFQLLDNSTLKFKNGTIKAGNAGIAMLIQNYANLTLDNMILDGRTMTRTDGTYALSNNNGNTVITGDTSIYAQVGKDNVAFDVCEFGGYTGATVTFDENYTGTVSGDILYDSSNADTHKLIINGKGTFEEIKFTEKSKEAVNDGVSVSGGTFNYGDGSVMNYVSESADKKVTVVLDKDTVIDHSKAAEVVFKAPADIEVENKTNVTVTVNTPNGPIELKPGEKEEVKPYEPPYIPPTPTPTPQKPTIEAEEGATVTLSKDGTTATIVVDKDATLKDVLLNGQSLGAVTEVKDLKTGDKLVVVVETAAEKNARLKAGVQNTTIKMYYNKKEIGKGWIKLRYKKSYGYKVDNYEIFRSAKKKTNFGDEAWFVTKTNKTKGFYKNGKSVKKGTRYYYKMRGVREIAGETVYTQWSNIVMRTGR